MGKMIFIPGMRPGTVSGAAGSTHRRSPGESLVFGPAKRGRATPRGLVPYEEPRRDDGRKARAAKEARARDVAEAYDMVKHRPNTTRDRLREARAEAAEVKV